MITNSGEIKLDLGAGVDYHEGFIRVDNSPECNPDVLLDVRDFPWPWENDSVDYIRSDNLFEHIEPNIFIKVMAECWRVLKPGGILWIRVPYIGFPVTETMIEGIFCDPTHQNFFTKKTFDYWDIDDTNNNDRYRHFGIQYGCKPFHKIRLVTDEKFIICELQKPTY